MVNGNLEQEFQNTESRIDLLLYRREGYDDLSSRDEIVSEIYRHPRIKDRLIGKYNSLFKEFFGKSLKEYIKNSTN